jgi:hypothetical protein
MSNVAQADTSRGKGCSCGTYVKHLWRTIYQRFASCTPQGYLIDHVNNFLLYLPLYSSQTWRPRVIPNNSQTICSDPFIR